jgi:hypothetical protein
MALLSERVLPHGALPRLLAGTVLLFMLPSCGPDLSGLFQPDYSTPETWTPPPTPKSILGYTYLGNGNISATAGGCRIAMPALRLQETGGCGGRLTGQRMTIWFPQEASGEQLQLEDSEMARLPGRYEAGGTVVVDPVFELRKPVPSCSVARSVRWIIGFTDDTGVGGELELWVPLDRFTP